MNNQSSIDLLALMGAQLRSVEINGKPQNCVIIPVHWNCVKVTENKETHLPNHAYLNMREWETSQKYKDACMERNADKEGYVPPSHQISVSYTEEFEKAARLSAEKRLRSDSDYMSGHPSDEDIEREAKYAVSNKARIGFVTPLKRMEQPIFTGRAKSAQGVGDYAPFDGEVNPGDDLPF